MTEPNFLLPSETEAPSKRDPSSDPGYVHGVDFDQWRRYLLPEPGGEQTELVPWTRVTTLAGCVTNQDGLRVWTEREMCRGIGRRVDLRNLLASAPDDVTVIDEVRETAKTVAGIGASASSGRALHRVVEARTDPNRTRDLSPIDPSEQFGRDCIAALECLRQNGIRVRAVELLVVHASLGYAGRLDALWEVTLPNGRTVVRIGDVKTGDKLDKPEKRHSMGVQLGGYANATHVYDPQTRTFRPLADYGIDHTAGYILSVRNGVAQLHEIDLLAGWQRMLTAVKVHRDRQASVDMLPVGRPVRIEAPEAVKQMLTGATWSPAPGLVSTVSADGQTFVTEMAQVQQQPAMPAPRPPSAGQLPVVVSDAVPEGTVAMTYPGQMMAGAIVNVSAEVAPADVSTPVPEPEPEVERSPSGRKRRACSKCRKPGHTAKHCPGGAASADETQGVGDDDPQGDAQPVDSGAEQPARVPICPHASGWTQRPSDGAWVCADCGRPSEATVAAMRTGGPLPTVGAPLVPVLENGATVARIDPAPGQPVAPVGTSVLEQPLEQSTAPAQVPVLGTVVDTPAPWLAQPAPAAPVDPRAMLPGEEVGGWLFRQIAEVIDSQEELGQLWQAHQAYWTQEHTDAAGARVAAGLPVIPPA